MQKQFDTNKDSRLDPNELEIGAKQVGRQLQDRSVLEESNLSTSKTKLLLRGTKFHKLLISNQKEKQMTSPWSRFGYAGLAVYGGGIMILGILVALGLVQLN